MSRSPRGTTGRPRLVAAMEGAHYPLQAILYIGGAAPVPALAPARVRPRGQPRRCALSVRRRMSSIGHPVVAGQPCGVFAWRPPIALIEALSDLFDQGRSAA